MHKIKVQGTDIPFPSPSFSHLSTRFKFKNYLSKNLSYLQFPSPSPIQSQSIPIILHGREILAIAPTGSGKTLAFVLPILHDLGQPSKEGIRALIISPTRELAMQVKSHSYTHIFKIVKGRFNLNMNRYSSGRMVESIIYECASFGFLIYLFMLLY